MSPGPGTPRALGVDIGGTHLRAALVDASGHIVHVVRHHLAGRDPAAMLDLMQTARDQLRGVYAAADSLPMGIGLAAQLWLRTGTVAVAPNLGWRDVPFGAMLRQRWPIPIRMVNDLNAIAVGEAAYGAAQHCSEMACVFVGTGVGMGAVVGGQVVEGADGLATELGHVKVEPPSTGRRCGCGEQGCLEAYTSGRHLPELLAAQQAAGHACPLLKSVAGQLNKITAGSIETAYSSGDAAAQALWQVTASYLGRAIGNAITLFNPQRLVLGGGVFTAAPSLKALAIAQIKAYAAIPAQTNLQICSSTLGDDAGIVGAALLSTQTAAGPAAA